MNKFIFVVLFSCVVFSPEHLSLVKAGPGKRRKFLDGALCQQKLKYAMYFSKYNQVLNQRNALLKDINKHPELKSTLEILEFDLLQKTNEVEGFIASIDDSRMRRIINLRFIENLSWNKVADHIGGGNTEDSIRMAFNRFMEK